LKRKSTLSVIVLVMLLFLGVAGSQGAPRAEAQFTGSVFINPDGSVTGTSSIQRNGDVYRLTGNISGGIQVQKSNIVIDGAGYTLWGNGESSRRGIDLSNDRGSDPSRPEITNVTIQDLRIVSFDEGIENVNTDNNIIIGNFVANCATAGINIIGSPNNVLIKNNTFANNGVAISLAYTGGNQTITGNDFIDNGIIVWLSQAPTCDRNYWSDYKTKYPNAVEIDSTGIGNTPYVFSSVQNGTQPINYQDNHPLIKPAADLYLQPRPSPQTQVQNIITSCSIRIEPNNIVEGQPINVVLQICPPPPSTNETFSNISLWITSPAQGVSGYGPWSKNNISSDSNGVARVSFDIPTFSGYWNVGVSFEGQYFANNTLHYQSGNWQTGFTITSNKTPNASPSRTPTYLTSTPSPSPSPSVPEFPMWTILPIAAAFGVIVCFKKRERGS